MTYQLFISEAARQPLRALDKPVRRNIGLRLERLREDLQGVVKKLGAGGNAHRLRVGPFRILFTLEGDRIAVHAVNDRKDAYA